MATEDGITRTLEGRLAASHREDLKSSSHIQHPFYRRLLCDTTSATRSSPTQDAIAQLLEYAPLKDKAQTVSEIKGKSNVLRLTNVRDKLNRSALNTGQDTGQTSSKGCVATQNGRFIRMSNKEAKLAQLYAVENDLEYADCLPLAHMWMQYIEDVLPKNMDRKQIAAGLMKADLHGAIMRVERSKCASYVGVKGIMIQETQQTLCLIAESNRMLKILKSHSVFSLTLHDNKYFINGQFLIHRPADRSKTKFKPKTTLLLK